MSLSGLCTDFMTYHNALRLIENLSIVREHDAQIVQIATEAGLRIAPDQWSSLLYGDTAHKSHMQSIIDKLQTPQSFQQSVQELVIALQRTGDPGQLGALRPHLDLLAGMDPSPDGPCPGWDALVAALASVGAIVAGLVTFMEQHATVRRTASGDSVCGSGPGSVAGGAQGAGAAAARYKTSLCRDLTNRGACPRGKNCTFAHSQLEIEQHRGNRRSRFLPAPKQMSPMGIAGPMGVVPQAGQKPPMHAPPPPQLQLQQALHRHPHQAFQPPPPGLPGGPPPPPHGAGALSSLTPVAQVAPLPRGDVPPAFVPPPLAAMEPPPQAAPPPPAAHAPPMIPMFAEQTAVAVAPAGPVVVQYHREQHHEPSPLVQRVMAPPPAAPPPTHMQPPPPPAPPVAAPPPPAAAPPPPPSAPVEHESNFERYPLTDEVKKDIPVTMSKGMAAKSLSALRSRKEEIIDYLEDLVGKEETAKIANRAVDVAPPPMSARMLGKQNSKAAEAANAILKQDQAFVAAAGSGPSLDPAFGPPGGLYSIWTSKSIATLPNKDQAGSIVIEEEEDDDGEDDSALEAGEVQEGGNVGEKRKDASVGEDDELIPFSDHPQISRFGPISRRAATLIQTITPSQTQAIISDEPMPTAVVRHSKQMAKQAPTLASLYHQNGSCTTLQPIAVGPNGEISYIAVQSDPPPSAASAAAVSVQGNANAVNAGGHGWVPPTPPHHQTDITLQHIMQNSAAHQRSPSPTHSSIQLYAESERMKQELEQLQKKISDLNMAHLDPARNRTAASSAAAVLASSVGAQVPPSAAAASASPAAAAAAVAAVAWGGKKTEKVEKEELAKELVMIESTIRDREREMTISHKIQAAAGVVQPAQKPTGI